MKISFESSDGYNVIVKTYSDQNEIIIREFVEYPLDEETAEPIGIDPQEHYDGEKELWRYLLEISDNYGTEVYMTYDTYRAMYDSDRWYVHLFDYMEHYYKVVLVPRLK